MTLYKSVLGASMVMSFCLRLKHTNIVKLINKVRKWNLKITSECLTERRDEEEKRRGHVRWWGGVREGGTQSVPEGRLERGRRRSPPPAPPPPPL